MEFSHTVQLVSLLYSVMSSAQSSNGVGYVLQVKFISYGNPAGSQSTGKCCDQDAMGLCTSPCDTNFRLCLRPGGHSTKPNQRNCTWDSVNPQAVVTGTSSTNYVVFNDTIFGYPNPIYFYLSEFPKKGVQLFIISRDEDENETYQVIDRYYIEIPKSTLGSGSQKHLMNGMEGSSTVKLSYKLYCAKDYYGMDCSIFCSTGESDDFTCDKDGHKLCIIGHNGADCSEAKNACSSNPCKNGGVCDNLQIGYTCNCPPGYTGKTCDSLGSSYSLRVKLIEYNNPTGQLLSGECCDTDPLTGKCNPSCDTNFRICLREGDHPTAVGSRSCNWSSVEPVLLKTDAISADHIIFNNTINNIVNPAEFKLSEIPESGIQLYIQVRDLDELINDMIINQVIDMHFIEIPRSRFDTGYHQCISTGMLGYATLNLAYELLCSQGYYGTNCSMYCTGWNDGANCTGISFCAPDPCENGGSCSNLITDYTCDCLLGYTGKNCEVTLITTITASTQVSTSSASAAMLPSPAGMADYGSNVAVIIGGILACGGVCVALGVMITLLLALWITKLRQQRSCVAVRKTQIKLASHGLTGAGQGSDPAPDQLKEVGIDLTCTAGSAGTEDGGISILHDSEDAGNYSSSLESNTTHTRETSHTCENANTLFPTDKQTDPVNANALNGDKGTLTYEYIPAVIQQKKKGSMDEKDALDGEYGSLGPAASQ